MNCSAANFTNPLITNITSEFAPPYYDGLNSYAHIMIALAIYIAGLTYAYKDKDLYGVQGHPIAERFCTAAIYAFLLAFVLFNYSTQTIAVTDHYSVIPNTTVCDIKFISNGLEETDSEHWFLGMADVIFEIKKQEKSLHVGHCLQKWKTKPSDKAIEDLLNPKGQLTFFTGTAPTDPDVQQYCWYKGNQDTWYLDTNGYNLIISSFVFVGISIISCCGFCISFFPSRENMTYA